VTWNRQPVAQALVSLLGPACGVTVHERPPETLNFPCLVVMRPTQVLYGAAGLGMDEVELPVAAVHGIETDDLVDNLKNAARTAILGNQGLGGVVKACWPNSERNWRNVTGAGGVQLLYVELILIIWM